MVTADCLVERTKRSENQTDVVVVVGSASPVLACAELGVSCARDREPLVRRYRRTTATWRGGDQTDLIEAVGA